jgi:uncharacterized NAD-dependent epimerase/dehydratase family protein
VPAQTPLVILSEGCFGESASKTGLGVIRYGDWPIVSVIDSRLAGQTVRQATGLACDAPVVADLEAALATGPKALLIGTAPQGGGLPSDWIPLLESAARQGLHLISGLHCFLRDIPNLVAAAEAGGVRLWDVRDCAQENIVAQQRPRPKDLRVVTLVGSDCSVGKMCTALELQRGAKREGLAASFLATGQTGILIAGRGVPLDRVIGDFMAGYVERELFSILEAEKPSWVFVEGQGSLLHPGYSGVTASLLHGSNPDALILCHNPSLQTIRNYHVPIPPLSELAALYEAITAAQQRHLPRQAQVAGIALNTSAFNEADALRLIAETELETGLPTTDPVRYGVDTLLKSLYSLLENVEDPPCRD